MAQDGPKGPQEASNAVQEASHGDLQEGPKRQRQLSSCGLLTDFDVFGLPTALCRPRDPQDGRKSAQAASKTAP
eukprot:5174534-Pyramimonas_sp.AAC.1